MQSKVEIQRLSSEGRGMAFIDRPCFVLGGLPGETIEVRVLKKHKGIFDAVAVSQPINPSDLRVSASCQHFLQCGACSLQHIKYQQQVILKTDRVKNLWQHAGYDGVKWAPAIIAEPYNYRRKARISVRWVEKKQKLLLGFKEQDARKILDMKACNILTRSIQEYIFKLQAVLSQVPEKKQIPQLELVAGDDGIAVVIRHLIALEAASIEALKSFAQDTGWHVWLQPKGYDSVHALSCASGYLHYNLPKYNLKIAFKPLDFIQVNAKINAKLVDLVLDWLDLQVDDTVLDLFCGLGNFSLPMAQRCRKVIGIEGSEEMVVRAISNADHAHLAHKVEFYKHDLWQELNNASWSNKSFTKVLLDPPRSGAKTCLHWLLRLKPQKIVYVSCNPESLVNDMQILLANGYVAKQTCIADMFPQTKHIEQVVCFERSQT